MKMKDTGEKRVKQILYNIEYGASLEGQLEIAKQMTEDSEDA